MPFKPVGGKIGSQEINDALSALDSEKLDKEALDNIKDASPKGTFATLADLQNAYPNGTDGIYIVTADGHWYFWDGAVWADGGTYQATEIADGSIAASKLGEAFNFQKTLTSETVLSLTKTGTYWVTADSTTTDLPAGENAGVVIVDNIAVGASNHWLLQKFININGKAYTRFIHQGAVQTDWVSIFNDTYNFRRVLRTEKILDLSDTGTYWVSGSSVVSDLPTGEDAGLVIVNKIIASANNPWMYQRFINLNGTTYKRVIHQGAIFQDWIRTLDENDLSNPAYPLSGKQIVNFGDSIFGNFQGVDSISGQINSIFGATTYNQGYGGCRMSSHPTRDPFCMYQLAKAITTQDFSYQQNHLTNGGDSLSYYQTSLDELKTIDFNQVEFITIAFGTNDYTADALLDNTSNPEDTTTFKGALRYSLRLIFETYPQIKIMVCTPTYRYWTDANGVFTEDSDTRTNANGDLLTDFVAATKEGSREFKTPSLDNYFELGVNKPNRSAFFADTTHFNPTGRTKMASKIGGALISRF